MRLLCLGRGLIRRSLRNPLLVVSDGAPGLIAAITELLARGPPLGELRGGLADHDRRRDEPTEALARAPASPPVGPVRARSRPAQGRAVRPPYAGSTTERGRMGRRVPPLGAATLIRAWRWLAIHSPGDERLRATSLVVVTTVQS